MAKSESVNCRRSQCLKLEGFKPTGIITLVKGTGKSKDSLGEFTFYLVFLGGKVSPEQNAVYN